MTTPDPPIVHPQVRTVRLLQGDEELQAALERASAFERRGIDDSQRRIGPTTDSSATEKAN
jgi:hypothetical protein